jgi:hypothetical protein
MSLQWLDLIITLEPSPSAMARHVTPRAAARLRASTILQPLLSASHEAPKIAGPE